ncbi:L-lactate utilization protein LutB [Clostridium algifaecis]|uniref:L-lactate utilization protein LutB n=1 Tax=Clostridium algifaecis TaxID=1472040 RepID=A0ABS4KRI7_9CLOT|nr:lactate utilization protein [Clostridium algifaecis]MBP2032016.1 L-lactate utilization protein LutB [Clostridium algifaecis]
MSNKKEYYKKLANTIINNLSHRGMEGFWTSTKEEALEKAISFLSHKDKIAWGDSQTLREIGFFDAVKSDKYSYTDVEDLFNEKLLDKGDETYSKIVTSDYYFLSSNAITINGELVNIDGSGNRLAAMMYGPKHVVVVVGMNKVCSDIESAYKRIKLIACPQNTIRFNYKTPCSITGKCADCVGTNCICTYTVITRIGRFPGRIKVILVGEELGY